jgi:predicted O-methyltransferase YrrM
MEREKYFVLAEQAEQKQQKQIEEQKKKEKDYKFIQDWFSPNISRWEKTLAHLKDQKINVLEIGVFEGRSTIWMLENLLKDPESKLVTIDWFVKFWGEYDHEQTFRENVARSGKEKQVEVIKSNSFDALVELNQQKRIKFDFIYIDGSHETLDVIADATLSWKLLKEGGIMIFDDYEWDYYEEEYNNPRLAIDAFLKCYQPQIQILYKRYQVAIKKISPENISKIVRDDKQIS